MIHSTLCPILWRLPHVLPRASHVLLLRTDLYSTKATPTRKPQILAKPIDVGTLTNEIPRHGSQFSELEPVSIIEPVASTKTSKKKKTRDDDWREMTLDVKKLPQYYLMLSKSRLTSLVVMTSMAGYSLAPAPFDLSTLLLCSVGTGLVSCAANATNQFFEVPFDSQMARTRNRVLVKGMLTPLHAVSFAAVCATTGLSILYFGINGLTATLGATNLILYTIVYTPMKRFSILNTWVGAIVGAIPPLMGWASCMDSLGSGAWIMAGILYAWQFPHFNSLSWNLRPEYSRAGYRMMSVTDPGLCRRTTLRYTAGILALSCAAPVLDVTNWWFALESIPLNAYFTYLAWQFHQNSDSGTSRKLFRFSLVHLPILMILMLINKKEWSSKKQGKDGQDGKS
ncbi:hypothetical protein R5R35_012155 [Gryllus longicercus]|uniref:Protoheme IX farnesyltransferase, mitochondrial n=1 Tax=Gryllus longicercus TaxID=2509291 RepID=A0AAN9WEX6_9ORTH